MIKQYSSRGLILFSLILCLFSCTNASSKHKIPEHLNKASLITKQDLLKNHQVFKQAFDAFTPDEQDLSLFAHLKNYDMVVVFGLWCHDSQREVPRLLKTIQESGVKLNSLQLITVALDKKLPTGIDQQFQVTNTPTIFVTMNNQILAKMVEKPKVSIGQELLSQILY